MRYAAMRGICAIVLALLAVPAWAGIDFVRGHLYSTSENAINQYDPVTGAVLGSLAIADRDLRGIAFGPDNLLYVVDALRSPDSSSVLVLDESGSVLRSMPFGGWIAGNTSHGKIAFDYRHRVFYVAASDAIYRFDPDGISGTPVTDVGGFDIAVKPGGGGFVVAESYALVHYDTQWNETARYGYTRDQNGGTLTRFVDVRGVHYSELEDATYVTMLGYTHNFHLVLKLAGMSALQLDRIQHGDGVDMTETAEGGVLVIGSHWLSPATYSMDLDLTRHMDGPDAPFVAVYPPTLLVFADTFDSAP